MKIVRAVPANAATLTHIALASKRYWNYPERWIALWTPQLTLTPDYIVTNEVYAAVEGEGQMDEIIGAHTTEIEGTRRSLPVLLLDI